MGFFVSILGYLGGLSAVVLGLAMGLTAVLAPATRPSAPHAALAMTAPAQSEANVAPNSAPKAAAPASETVRLGQWGPAVTPGLKPGEAVPEVPTPVIVTAHHRNARADERARARRLALVRSERSRRLAYEQERNFAPPAPGYAQNGPALGYAQEGPTTLNGLW
jgi:hypothetical protein